VVEKCSDIDAGVCFSNSDCPGPAQHCGRPVAGTLPDGGSTLPDPSVVIMCCIPGAPGTGQAGAACQSADGCATAVCAYTPSGSFCSQSCDTAQAGAGCPSTLPACVTLDAGVDGGLVSFCGPTP
jgi:hypothetical protein